MEREYYNNQVTLEKLQFLQSETEERADAANLQVTDDNKNKKQLQLHFLICSF